MNDDSYFILYANCIPVKGYKRSLIYDLQMHKYYFIPNSLYEIIIQLKSTKFNKVRAMFSKDILIFDEYFNYLVENDLGFFTSDPSNFSNLQTLWEYPALITNAIVDFRFIEKKQLRYYAKIFEDLSNLNCSCVELRFFEEITEENIISLMENFNNSRIRDIRIILKYTYKIEDEIKNILQKYGRIRLVTIYNCLENEGKEILGVKIIFNKTKQLNLDFCGQIDRKTFIINIDHFMESKKFNNCLNRKISIDFDGNIKNCPSSQIVFGNIFKNNSIFKIFKKKQFKEKWMIHKDLVEVCKDCEYRYMCSDCRINIRSEENIYSKPKYCKYDPCTAEWKD